MFSFHAKDPFCRFSEQLQDSYKKGLEHRPCVIACMMEAGRTLRIFVVHYEQVGSRFCTGDNHIVNVLSFLLSVAVNRLIHDKGWGS